MSQQLALSSLFSALALAAMCLAATNGMVRRDDVSLAFGQPVGAQTEANPGLRI